MASARPNNNGTITGRIVTKNINLVTNGAHNTLRLSIAVDNFVPKDKQNDPNYKKSEFIPVVFFGDDAKNLAQWGKAGKWVQIVYHLRLNTWTDNNNTKRYDVELICDSWQFMPVVSGNGNGNGQTAGAQNGQPTGDQNGVPVAGDGMGETDGFYPLEDEDLPF